MRPFWTLQPTSKFWKFIFTHTNSVRRHIFGVNLILQCLSTCSVVFSTILSTEKTHFRAFQSNILGIFWSKHHFFANGFDKFPFASFSLFCWVFSWYKLISYTCFIDYLQCVKMHFQNQEVGRESPKFVSVVLRSCKNNWKWLLIKEFTKMWCLLPSNR